MNALDLGQWIAVDAIVSENCPNPELVAAVEAELSTARATYTAHANTTETDQEALR